MAGRKSLYETNVLPFLEKIKQWIMYKRSDEFIAENLLIGYSTWMNYKATKKEIKELQEAAVRERVNLVDDLKKTLYESSTGFEFEETKTIIASDNKGKPHIVRKEIYKKRALPNISATKELLELLDDEYVGRKASLELKKEELDFKKEQAKIEKDWKAIGDDDSE